MRTMFAPADNFGIQGLLPDMQGFLGNVRFYLGLFLLIGPVLMLIFGVLRFFIPAKEANYSVGYRTFFGMGSVYAWKATQWVSGLVFMGLGGVLTVLAVIQCFVNGGMDLSGAAGNTCTWLIVEGIALMIGVIAVEVLIGMQFDRQGALRPGRKLFFLAYVPYKEASVKAQEPAPHTPAQPMPELEERPDAELFTQENFFDFDALLNNDSVPTENPKNKE